ncbi:MAG: glycosyltransferase [Nitrospirae bacterium]|nr:glycosyltransferase [Nitrospirota bacterium]
MDHEQQSKGTPEMKEESYYKQEALWAKPPEPYQVQMRADILSMIPEGTGSILDVGCGDGFITNRLPEGIDVTGMDISEEALKHVTRGKMVGSISSIPFPDSRFDLVMANDVIEHLPEELYQRALPELFRVSSKYVLLTVPYAEQLEKSYVKCAHCATLYHINYHHRSFTEEGLISLRPKGWRPVEIRYSGDVTRPPFDPMTSLYQELDVFDSCENCICPECGRPETVQPAGEYTRKILRKLRGEQVFKDNPRHINRSEIIVLFSREDADKKPAAPPRPEGPKRQEMSLLRIDFGNPLQRVSGFSEGAIWALYSQAKVPGDNTVKYWINFPVIPAAGDRIIVSAEGPASPEDVLLFSHDQLHNLAIKPAAVSLSEDRIEYRIEKDWPVDIFGAGASIQWSGRTRVRTVEYLPADAEKKMARFLALDKGHTVLAGEGAGYVRSWGYYADTPGLVPEPLWLWDGSGEQLTGSGSVRTYTVSDFKDELERVMLHIKNTNIDLKGLLEAREAERVKAEEACGKKLQELNGLLEMKESERVKAEEACGKKLQELNGLLEARESERVKAEEAYRESGKELQQAEKRFQELNGLLEAKEVARAGAEEAYGRALEEVSVKEAERAKYHRFYVNSLTRRINRVLILSHMFPDECHKNLGCFVAEQARALREHEGLDARVVSCRPFWINTVSPLRVAGALFHYNRQLYSAQWFIRDGVPTLFVPYVVGSPYFPFMVHGFTHLRSVRAIAGRLRRDFNFDLVHAHTGYLDGYAGRYLARRFKTPFVITEHMGPFSLLTDNPVVRAVTLKSMAAADRIICVSPALEGQVRKWLSPKFHDKFTVLPNGVNTELFHPGTQGRVPEYPKAEQELLTVISLDENKNPFCLLEAFKKLREKGLGCRLRIVGDGPLFGKIKDWTGRNGLAGSIELLGRRTREEIAALMRDACDVFVLPSRSETFGVVVIEALVSGKPVVSTRSGGPESIITEPYLGELCENDNPLDLASAIEKVLNNPGNYPSGAIREFAERNFSYERLSGRLVGMYQDIFSVHA